MTPSLAAPIVWPARPMRCMPLATDGGASIWTTRSIAPMSMPSSSDEVATSAAKLAGLQQVLDLDPLRPRERAVVRAHERLAGELVERRGQPLGEAPAVDEDQRRAVRAISSSSRGWIAVQIDVRDRPLRGRAARDLVRSGRSSPCPRPAPRCVSSSCFFSRRVDDRDRPVTPAPSRATGELVVDRVVRRRAVGRRRGRGLTLRRSDRRDRRSGDASPPRNRATSSSGRCVADSPMRCRRRAGVSQRARAARATAPGARRAWSAPARGSRR